jgi:hypothetical protein
MASSHRSALLTVLMVIPRAALNLLVIGYLPQSLFGVEVEQA